MWGNSASINSQDHAVCTLLPGFGTVSFVYLCWQTRGKRSREHPFHCGEVKGFIEATSTLISVGKCGTLPRRSQKLVC
jgi:hypothetical protein